MFPDAGLNEYACDALIVEKLEPSVLDCTLSVWLRVSQPEGSLSTRYSTVAAAPRSTCAHCGNVLLVDSQ